MAYDEYLAERIQRILDEKHVLAVEKRMMGGLVFMVDDKMCCGVMKDELMARIDPEEFERAISLEGSKPLAFSGKTSRGFLFVEPEGLDNESDLEHWIQLCINFNPKAKSSKSKKKKVTK